MEQQEKKVIADIKKMAKAGQMVWWQFLKNYAREFNVSESSVVQAWIIVLFSTTRQSDSASF